MKAACLVCSSLRGGAGLPGPLQDTTLSLPMMALGDRLGGIGNSSIWVSGGLGPPDFPLPPVSPEQVSDISGPLSFIHGNH